MFLVSTAVISSIFLGSGSKRNSSNSENQIKVDIGFQNNFPKKYTCDGSNISPPIKFRNLPENLKTLAVVIDDPDAPVKVFDHWIIWNIPPSQDLGKDIPKEEFLQKGVVQGENDFGEIGYNGPCPTTGTHNYRIKVYALNKELDIKAGASKERLESAMESHIIDKEVIRRSYSG